MTNFCRIHGVEASESCVSGYDRSIALFRDKELLAAFPCLSNPHATMSMFGGLSLAIHAVALDRDQGYGLRYPASWCPVLNRSCSMTVLSKFMRRLASWPWAFYWVSFFIRAFVSYSPCTMTLLSTSILILSEM